MQISSSLQMLPQQLAQTSKLNLPGSKADDKANAEHREAFCDAFGQTLFSQVLGAMRKTLDKPAYFHGGKTEEVFQAQLDQVFAEKMSDSVVDTFTGPIFDQLTRRTY